MSPGIAWIGAAVFTAVAVDWWMASWAAVSWLDDLSRPR